MELFDSTKRRLYDILKDVQTGKIQLPDFQRGWIWDDYRIVGLLASIAKSFPIGAIMLLETGNGELTFKTRPVESVDTPLQHGEPEELILDGQQRITSLYQAIFSNKVVRTRNDKKQEIKRWYYIDMNKAIDPNLDFEEAIFSINEDKKITRDFGREIVMDLTTEEKEFAALMYPVNLIDEYTDWRRKFSQYWQYDHQKMRLWDVFEVEVISHFTHYQLPIIRLKKENSKEAVCQVFEKVNTGGVSLNVFELLTATFASDSFDLRENWQHINLRLRSITNLQATSNTDFLQSVTLLSTFERREREALEGKTDERLPAVTCKKKDVLNLSLNEYRRLYERILAGYIKAGKLLLESHLFRDDDLPYVSQLVPLSTIFAVLGTEADNLTVKKKLMKWYWCGVFGELYGSANETRYALDVQQVIGLVRGTASESNVKTIYEANFNPSRLNTLKTRNSAAYKGVYALLLNNGAKDWINGQSISLTTYFSEYIDVHHVFPRKWCEQNNIPRKDYDNIINKTPLSARTNRIIGGNAPSVYLKALESRLHADKGVMSGLLESHRIAPPSMYNDDFNQFFEERKLALLQLIYSVMGTESSQTTIEPEQESTDSSSDELVQEDGFTISEEAM